MNSGQVAHLPSFHLNFSGILLGFEWPDSIYLNYWSTKWHA